MIFSGISYNLSLFLDNFQGLVILTMLTFCLTWSEMWACI